MAIHDEKTDWEADRFAIKHNAGDPISVNLSIANGRVFTVGRFERRHVI
jgi:hypothetical protein